MEDRNSGVDGRDPFAQPPIPTPAAHVVGAGSTDPDGGDGELDDGEMAPTSDAGDSGHVPRRQPRRRRRLIIALGAAAFLAWSTAAFTYGLSVGEKRRVEPPAPPPSIVVDVQQIAVPDSVDAPTDSVPVIKMANVIGLSQADALAVLGGSGLDPGAVTVAPVGVAGDPGLVVSQDPVPGPSSPTAVSLSVSAPIDVPAMVGETLDDARSTIEELGAVVTLKSRYQPGSAPGTVLEVDPATGPTPSSVILTVASAPASMDLHTLRPVDSENCSYGQKLTVNGISGTASATCNLSTVWPEIAVAVYSIDYDLSRKADELSFTVGFTDNSDIKSTAVVDVVVDGAVVQSPTVGFGQSVDVTISVSNALRLQFVVRPTLAGTADAKVRGYGNVVVLNGVLNGSETNIGILSGTGS